MANKNRDFVSGMIVGVAVGLAASFIIASRYGGGTSTQNLQRATEQAKQKAMELTEKGKEYIETKRSQFQEAVEEGKRAAEEKRHELESEVRAETQPIT